MLAPSTITGIESERDGIEQTRQVEAALQSLQGIAGLAVYRRTVDGKVMLVMGEGQGSSTEPIPESAWSQPPAGMACFTLDSGGTLLIEDRSSGGLLLKPATALAGTTLRMIEGERREELLLEELSASWESLEAHYEISTDVLRCMNIDETLKRLIDRLVSMHVGLHGTLFVRRLGLFAPLVSTEVHTGTIEQADLGPLDRITHERQSIAIPYVPNVDGADVCWRKATMIAAAPITSRQDCNGFLVIWSEERTFEFDSAFLRLLEAIAYQASILIERDRLTCQVRESDLLAKELEIASSIQETLLLGNAPRDVRGVEIAVCSLPSAYIDGDFHDFFEHPDGTLDVIVGDVMGKGVAAAVLGAATKSQLLRSIAALALRRSASAPSPVEIVRQAASCISHQLISVERFVTMCYARFDIEAQLLHLVDCGHTSTIRNRHAEDCAFLRSDDLPLGVLQPYTCTQQTFTLRPGDTYLFYSDGVTECRSPDGELFGPERLAACVQDWSALGPSLLVERILRDARLFTGMERFADDFTCIAVRMMIGGGGGEPRHVANAIFPAVTDELTAFREWLQASFQTPGGYPLGEEAARVELACSELFVNFAKHQPDTSPEEFIRVEARSYRDFVTIQLMHKGPAFDPLSIRPPAFDGSRDDGFGTYIVLRSADEAKYERNAEGINLITVCFRRTGSNNPYATTT